MSNTDKTFVIDNPVYPNKYLVHACLEGPEVGVYYRGKASITNNNSVEIELPEYVKYISDNFTVQLTKIFTDLDSFGKFLETSEVVDGKFTVYGQNSSFYWLVHALRKTIEVEPEKDKYVLKGDGPYTYIVKL